MVLFRDDFAGSLAQWVIHSGAWDVSGVKAAWIDDADIINTTLLNRLVQSNTFFIPLYVGNWLSNGSVQYIYNDIQIANILNMIRNFDARFEIQATIWSDWDATDINIASSSLRTTMANAAVQCMNKEFDGFNDDLEGYTGRDADDAAGRPNYIAWLNTMSSAIRAVGKHSSGCIGSYYNVNWASVDLDHITAMFYTNSLLSQTDFTNSVNRILPNSFSPVFVGMLTGTAGWLSTQLNWLNACSPHNYAKYVGPMVFCAERMDANDWAVWETY